MKKEIYHKDNYTLVVKDIDLYITKEKIAFFLQDGELLFTTIIEKGMKPDKLFEEFIDGMKCCNFFGVPEEVRTD